MNSVPTAQVILGIDSGDGTGETAFLEFENGRKSPKAGKVAEWYKAHKQHIVLSTLDNSEIIKFTHSFNLQETQDQALFVLEILDPNNTFEKNFFNRFFKGLENYSQFIDNTLEDAKHRYVDKKAWQLSLSPTEAGESLGKEGEDSFGTKNLGAGLGNIAREPYTKPLFITFGLGTDMNLWSPVQKAQLVTLEYELTTEGVKKYIIKCVANTGLLALGELQSVEQYVKGTARVEYRASVPFIFPKNYSVDPEEILWSVHSPVKIVTELIGGLLKNVLKEPPFLLFQDLEKVLQGRWSKAVINYFKQKTDVLYKEKFYKDTSLPNDNFDTDQLAIRLARMVAPVQAAPLRALKEGGTLLGFDAEAAVGRREDLEGHGFIVDSAAPDFNADQLDSMFNEYLAIRATQGLSLPPTPTTAEIATNRSWYDKSFAADTGWRRGPQDRTGKIADPAGLFPEIGFRSERSVAAGKATAPAVWKQITEGQLPDYISTFLEAYPSGDVGYQGAPKTYAELKERAAAYFNKNYVDLNYVSVDTKKYYAIYKAAGKDFFENLGFTVVERARDPATMIKSPTLFGPSITQKQFAEEGFLPTLFKPLDVEIKKDSSKEVSNALGQLLDNMGLDPEDEPLILGYSELSLINKFRNSPALIAAGFDATQAELAQMQTVIIATSVRIISSITNGTELDELKDNKLYMELLNLFSGFKKEEPSLAITDAPSFSPLFANPDLDTTRLPGQTNGVPNYLTVFGNLGGLGRQEPFRTNEEFSRTLAEERIPVFNYGFKNSNVVSFNFNLRPWYAYFLDVIPTTIMTGLISAALSKEPVFKTVLSFYNDIKGDPNVAIQKAIAKFWKENVADPLTSIKLRNQKLKVWGPAATASVRGYVERLKKDTAKLAKTGASINAVRSLGDFAMGDVLDLPSFKKVVTAYVRVTLSSPSLAQRLIVNPEMQSTSLQKLLTMRHKLATRVFTGTLTTVPLFSIISPARTISSRALLYFVEPEFMMSPVEKNSTLRSTWLSGEYYIVGYEVEFSGSNITTKFNVVKNPDKAQGLNL